MEYTATQLRQLQKVYKNFTETEDDEIEYLSSKVRCLVDVLKDYRREQGISKRDDKQTRARVVEWLVPPPPTPGSLS